MSGLVFFIGLAVAIADVMQTRPNVWVLMGALLVTLFALGSWVDRTEVDVLGDPEPDPVTPEPPLVRTVDTTGWSHVRHRRWQQDRRYIEVWGSRDGKHWTMLGMEAFL